MKGYDVERPYVLKSWGIFALRSCLGDVIVCNLEKWYKWDVLFCYQTKESNMVFRPPIYKLHFPGPCLRLSQYPGCGLRICIWYKDHRFKREYTLGSSSRQSMLEIRTNKLHNTGGFPQFCFYAQLEYMIIQFQGRKQRLTQSNTSSLSLTCQRRLQPEVRSSFS